MQDVRCADMTFRGLSFPSLQPCGEGADGNRNCNTSPAKEFLAWQAASYRIFVLDQSALIETRWCIALGAASVGAPGGSAAGGVHTQPSQVEREGRDGGVRLMRTPLARWMRHWGVGMGTRLAQDLQSSS